MLARTASKLRLLVVDDDPLLLRGLQEVLILWGFGAALGASDGEEAVERLLRTPVDLLLTDWIMPGADGSSLVHWVRAAPNSPCPRIPIIVLTGRSDMETVRCAWDLGVDAVLAKPVSPILLAERIATVLRRPRRSLRRSPAPRPPPRLALPAPQGDGDERPSCPPSPLPPQPPVRVPAAWTAVDGEAQARRIGLLMLVDRLEAAADNRRYGRLHTLADELLHAAGEPLVGEFAASLAQCVAQVRAGAPGQADAIYGHIAGLRATLFGDPATEGAARVLLNRLKATVHFLTRSSPATARPIDDPR